MRRFLERVLGADLREGEGLVVGLFALDLFLLLTAYYVLKVIREPLILIEGGAIERSYARGVQALLLLGLVPAYSALVNRTNARRMVDFITASFVLAVLVFWALARANVRIGFVFFVWLGIFSTLSIAQFWSLANDLFSEEQGKRVFPVVAVGGTLGGIAGAQLAARAAALSPPTLMLVSGGILAAHLVLSAFARRVAERRGVAGAVEPRAMSASGGFRLVVSDRYLALIGASILMLNVINTNGEYILAELVTRASLEKGGARSAEAAAFIATFYGDFQTWVSVLTAAVQLFAVARIFRAVGVRVALFALPAFALGGYGLLALLPFIGVAKAVKVVENSADYSLQNTLHQTLFLPTSRDAKYKAKAATDTLFVRLGDLGSTAVVFAGVHAELTISGFSALNAVAAAGWIGIAIALARGYRERSSVAANGRVAG